ncbi:selenide, water dikinase SelD [Granulosicoccaceae sp. 1_MG-2023]|nr:selenide, water dikinase SelD [Granulosicoccaceae sp. 1_MG-2023]
MDGPVPVKDLLLVGGGHAHALVIRRFAMKPLPGVRLTLISRDPLTPYSGMLPGLVAGHYTFDETHIDLVRLCRRAGVRFIAADVCGLDPQQKTIQLRDRPEISYDLLSLDTGSAPDTQSVAGAAEHSTPVKPVSRFFARWQSLLKRLEQDPSEAPAIAVVGSGAGGFELLMAMQHALARHAGKRPQLHWLIRGREPLNGYPARVRRQALTLAQQAAIQIHSGFDVASVGPRHVHSHQGDTLQVDEVIWCTGATGPQWLQNTGLALCDKGFLAVDEHLRSLSNPAIFAAGDVATQVSQPRPKAGVFAVRAGPYLYENLLRSLTARPLKRFRPQKDFLSILATGPRHAIAAKGAFSVSGKLIWRWKDRIDRRFMARFDPASLPDSMHAGGKTTTDPALLQDAPREQSPYRCAGCGAKVAADILMDSLSRLPGYNRAGAEDAVLLELPGQALVQTVDQLRAICDDPWLFARIATQHALSDLHASLAKPHSAMAMITLPYASEALQARDLMQVMQGVVGVLQSNDCRLIGGHSSEMPVLSIGLSINGIPGARHYDKSGLRPGDKLILSKPIGTGVLLAGDMRALTHGADLHKAFAVMQTGNGEAAGILAAAGASAMTDVTGFGLLGHLGEMLDAAGLSADIGKDALPVLDGADALFAAGIHSSLQAMNARNAARLGIDSTQLSAVCAGRLFDPQTSGGLLAGIAADAAEECLAALQAAGYPEAAVIGEVRHAQPGEPRVRLLT